MQRRERLSDQDERGPGFGSAGAMPLLMAAEGQEVTLAEVRGGKEFLLRLAEMGLTPGARFRILQKGRPGPFIVSVKESRLVLGRGMIHRIFVQAK